MFTHFPFTLFEPHIHTKTNRYICEIFSFSENSLIPTSSRHRNSSIWEKQRGRMCGASNFLVTEEHKFNLDCQRSRWIRLFFNSRVTMPWPSVSSVLFRFRAYALNYRSNERVSVSWINSQNGTKIIVLSHFHSPNQIMRCCICSRPTLCCRSRVTIAIRNRTRPTNQWRYSNTYCNCERIIETCSNVFAIQKFVVFSNLRQTLEINWRYMAVLPHILRTARNSLPWNERRWFDIVEALTITIHRNELERRVYSVRMHRNRKKWFFKNFRARSWRTKWQHSAHTAN